jgi:predicted transposase YdaD
MTERRPFDVNMRLLATRHGPDFLQWFLGEDVRFERTEESVMVSVERRADLLVSFQDEDELLKLLHAEFQLQIDENDPAKYPPFRMFEYAAMARRSYGQVPIQILVLMENTAAARRIPDHFAEGNVRVSYRVIRLWEEDPQVILDSGLTGLLPLLPLMAGSSADLLEESLSVLEERLESGEERAELMKVAALLASIRTKPDIIRSILRGRAMVNLMEETPLGRELLAEREARIREAEQAAQAEGLARGQAEGLARGQAEGLARGQAEGLRQAVLRLIAHRFGTVPEDVRQQLRSIVETERLNRLLDAAYDATDLEAFRRQLTPSS